MTTVTEGLQTLKLEQLHESPWNPRKLFDPAKLQELADSITANGIIEPLLARPNAKGFELAAGHRRYRAAKLAGLHEAPVIIRAMTDVQFLEVLMIDNLQREDLTALEEAEGYHALMTKGKYTVQRLAERIGRSEKYVYDRVKLLQLTPAAQKHLREGAITAGHAILLARLKPKDQERALAVDDKDWRNRGGGVFEFETTLFEPDLETDEEHLKPRSVRELQAWIDEHVRFDRGAVDAMLFPETATTVAAAKEKAEKIVPITHDHTVPEEARAEERTVGPRSWERADGKYKSKTCDYSVTGVIVVGPGRGDAFKVCTNKDKCKVHWGTLIRAREQRAKASPSKASAKASTQEERARREEQRREADQRREQAERTRWQKARPAILEAIAEKIKKAPAGSKSLLGAYVLGAVKGYSTPRDVAEYVPIGTAAEDLVRHAAFVAIATEANPSVWDLGKKLPRIAKDFGVDAKKILEEVAPLKEDKPAAKK